MKARRLKAILNDTGYIVADYVNFIAVGSPLCHDLFKVDKQTLTLTYALAFNREDPRTKFIREGSTELLFIWDTLTMLIINNGIQDIVEGQDELDNPLPVYHVEDGKLIEYFTDAYGWPNVTSEGRIMYDNSYSRTKREAIEYAIREYTASVELGQQRADDLKQELNKLNERILTNAQYVIRLNQLLPQV